MSWTTAQDVLDAWIGDDKPAIEDEELINIWIGKAERHIRSKVTGITNRVHAGEPDLIANIQDVVTAMVQRVFRNPKGIRQTNEGTGPFNSSQTFGGENPGALVLTDDEFTILSGSGGSGQKAFSIPMFTPRHGGETWV